MIFPHSNQVYLDAAPGSQVLMTKLPTVSHTRNCKYGVWVLSFPKRH